MEEEQYSAAVIRDFERGFLDIPQDTHLRKFVSRVLSCEDMRISKVYISIFILVWCFSTQPFSFIYETKRFILFNRNSKDLINLAKSFIPLALFLSVIKTTDLMAV